MTTTSTSWRLALALRLGNCLGPFPGIRASVVAGSVARGYSDVWSDLELITYWDEEPNNLVRAHLMQTIGATTRYPAHHPGHTSSWLIGGFPVDVWQFTLASQDTMLDTVLDQYSTDLLANNRVETIHTAITVSGDEFVHAWQQRTSVYPPALTVRFIEEYLPHFHLRHLCFAARRDNPTAFFHTLSDIQCSLFLVLLALNGAWFPTYKWMYQSLDTMRVAPTSVGPRLRTMYTEHPVVAVEQLRTVLDETVTLIEQSGLGLDSFHIDKARDGVSQTIKAYEMPILSDLPHHSDLSHH